MYDTPPAFFLRRPMVIDEEQQLEGGFTRLSGRSRRPPIHRITDQIWQVPANERQKKISPFHSGAVETTSYSSTTDQIWQVPVKDKTILGYRYLHFIQLL